MKMLQHGPRSGGEQPNMALLMNADVFQEQISQYNTH